MLKDKPDISENHLVSSLRWGWWNAIRYQILDPLKNQISDIRPPKIRYLAKKIRYISDPQKNQLSDITPPKKSNIRYQGTPVPPPTPLRLG